MFYCPNCYALLYKEPTKEEVKPEPKVPEPEPEPMSEESEESEVGGCNINVTEFDHFKW